MMSTQYTLPVASHVHIYVRQVVLFVIVPILVLSGFAYKVEAATIEFVSFSTYQAGPTGNSCNPSIPSGSAAGDFMIAFTWDGQFDGQQTWDNDGGGGNGWTQIDENYTSTGNNLESALYYKIHDGSEPTPTFTAGGGNKRIACMIITYSGVSTSNPLDVTYSQGSHFDNTVNDDTPNAPDITTNTNGAMVLTFHGIHGGALSGDPPTNYMTVASTTGAHRNLYMAQRTIASAGSETIGSWNHTGGTGTSESHVWTVALRPGVGPAATTFTTNVLVTGDAHVDGVIAKGSGTFVIDHPLDPANKLLYHSFVESPDAKNIYDGVATLDESGEAEVRLPKYFLELNTDFRYLASPVDGAMPNLHVAKELYEKKFWLGLIRRPVFVIGGGEPGGTVSWQVTGIRKDVFIEENPIIPEVEKTGETLVRKGECLYKPLCQ